MWAVYDCLRSQERGGATGVLTHLEVWAPNMLPAEAEPLPAAAFHPPAWHGPVGPPPSCTQARRGGGGAVRASSNRRTPVFAPRPPPPRIQGSGWSLCYGRLQ